MFKVLKKEIKSRIKRSLWKWFSDNDGLREVTVLSGPCRGARIVVDFRYDMSYWLGSYDRSVLGQLKKLLRSSSIAFDCGAYLGIYAAAMRQSVGPAGIVHVFEASSKNYRRVARLPILNKWTNVYVHHLAVGEAHGVIRFASNLGAASGPIDMPGKRLSRHDVQIEEVQCSGIDELIFERGLPEPDFMKLDLETAECFALRNGVRLWNKKRPSLLIELHRSKNERPFAFEAAEEFLRAFNYRGTEVHLGIPMKNVEDFLKAERHVQCTILAIPE